MCSSLPGHFTSVMLSCAVKKNGNSFCITCSHLMLWITSASQASSLQSVSWRINLFPPDWKLVAVMICKRWCCWCLSSWALIWKPWLLLWGSCVLGVALGNQLGVPRLCGSALDKSIAQRRVISRQCCSLYSFFQLLSQTSPLPPNVSFWHSLSVHTSNLSSDWRGDGRLEDEILCAPLCILNLIVSS